jgi:hypothetical protein
MQKFMNPNRPQTVIQPDFPPAAGRIVFERGFYFSEKKHAGYFNIKFNGGNLRRAERQLA